MFLSIATTHQPAADFGYLLAKHPDRLHKVELAFGRAIVLFPEATDTRCEAALSGIGADDPVHGPITQMAVFSR